MRLSPVFKTILTSIMIVALTACAPGSRRTGEYVDDKVIGAKVKAALAADPDVKATEVNVETFKGMVQLSGFVDSPEAARRALEIARRTEGVRDVKNDMRVRPK